MKGRPDRRTTAATAASSNIGNLGKLKAAVTLKRSILTAKPDIEGRDYYPLLAQVGKGATSPKMLAAKSTSVISSLPRALSVIRRVASRGSYTPIFERRLLRIMAQDVGGEGAAPQPQSRTRYAAAVRCELFSNKKK